MNDDLQTHVARRLPELTDIYRALDQLEPYARIETLAEIDCNGQRLPIHAVSLGPDDPTTPVLGFFGGVHGLEKIGTQLCVSFMHTVAKLLSWDEEIAAFLKKARLLFVPLVNPGGMYLCRRANPSGVDLMRNAPVEAETLARFRPLSGHRISPIFPWYRGVLDAGLEPEAAAVVNFVKRSVFSSRCAISLDIHSGFGLRDRLWFPYAKSVRPFPQLPELFSLVDMFEQTYPNNVYRIEPQSKVYTTHGDLWDYLFDLYREAQPQGVYLPLCLELGSWSWVKKNPKQLFSLLGAFNPTVLHRLQRTMRRHLVLFDFLRRAVLANDRWAFLEPALRRRRLIESLDLWYPELSYELPHSGSADVTIASFK